MSASDTTEGDIKNPSKDKVNKESVKAVASKRNRRLKVTKSESDKYTENITKIFTLSGFSHVKSDGIKIEFKGRESDIDNIFVYENVLVLCEETTTAATKVVYHLGKKNLLYSQVEANELEFVKYLFSFYSDLKQFDKFPPVAYKIIILYCSFNGVDEVLKTTVSKIIKFLDKPGYFYFLDLANAIKKSSRFELFDFLGVKFNDVGMRVVLPSINNDREYDGFLLPKAASDFAKDYRVVTFYMDPATLIERAFVLRRSGWRDSGILYQRPLIAKKISKMREHLQLKKGVFVNNIIVTLPNNASVKLLGEDNIDSITRMSTVKVRLPDSYNSVCIIDGQHRVFSYHEGDDRYENSINVLRVVQNLLATAIFYPENTTDEEKAAFEANLFVDINSKQSNVNTALIQSIKLIIDRFSVDAIAREVLEKLNAMSTLNNEIAVHPYEEKTKLKPTTIVSYALRVLVKLGGNDSTFFFWDNPNKDELLLGQNYSLLNDYISFSAREINLFLSAFRQHIINNNGQNRWDSGDNGVIRVMVINGLIHCLKLVIESGKAKIDNRTYYVDKFYGVEDFPFSSYRGSVWSALGKDLYNKYFA